MKSAVEMLWICHYCLHSQNSTNEPTEKHNFYGKYKFTVLTQVFVHLAMIADSNCKKTNLELLNYFIYEK